ncbi:MAG: response regulator [Desulfobacterales bacterium]|jgi:CheY-like chemotaxis protein
MDVVCDKCEAKFKIPDEKVPKGQAFSLACPKCKSKITVDPRSGAAAASGDGGGGDALAEASTGDYDASDKPFDFLEEGAETALVCESEPDLRAQVRTALQDLGYQIREPKTPIEALKQMRFHVFDVIVLDELFGTEDPDENNVLRFLERMAMDTRRDIFLALITERFRTNDHMAAFNKSVNMVINRKNINDFGTIIKRGVAENVAFYRVFREAMLKTGRA